MSPRARLSASGLAVVLLLGGCGGGDSPATDATATTAAGKAGKRDRTQKEASRATCPDRPESQSSVSTMSFADATADRGLLEPLKGMFGHAAAAGDVQGDGWTDLFVGTFADKAADEYRQRGAEGPAPDRLLLGGPDGFATAEGFPAEAGRSSGAVFADLDGDGDPDLVVSRNGKAKNGGGAPTTLYRNDGGRFRPAGDLPPSTGARAIAVLDYDGDGRLDLFITADRYSGRSSVLLRNKGDLAFEDRTDAAGLPAVAGLGVAAVDVDADRRTDLFVTDSNRLFLGQARGTFKEATGSTFEWERYGDEDDAAGVAVGDLDVDGKPDLVVGQHYNTTVDRGCKVPVRVYLNRTSRAGDVAFEDVTVASGVPWFPTKAPHVEIVDVDNDGRPDLVTSASALDGTRPAVLRNLGASKGVPRFATPAGLGDEQYWVTGATGDFDHDGRVDIFLVDFEPAKPSMLFRNTSSGSGHWLQVTMAPDAQAVGAVVSAFEAGTSKLLAASWITLGAGYAGGAASSAHLGLGAATEVDLVVRTSDGETHRRTGVDVDQRLRWPQDFD